MTSASAVSEKHDFSTHKTDDHFCPACAFSCSSEDQLIAQLEYYFSQDNIITDYYLRSQMDDENYVPIMTISTFTKVKQYIEDVKDPEQFIATLVQNKSDVLQVDDYGLKIRAQSGPVKYRLVVRDVPATKTRDDIQQMFTNCEIKMLSAEPAGCNGMWYLGFETEADSHSAMEHLKSNYNLKVHMKKILAGHHVPSNRAPSANSVSGHFWNGNYPISQTPPTQVQNSIHYNEYGTANWTQLNRTVKGPKGSQQPRTMYQPFRRGGYEQGVPQNNVFLQRPSYNVSYQPTSRAHRSRPRDSKERLKVHTGRKIESSPETPLTVPITRLHKPNDQPNKTSEKENQPSFELKQFDFPSLALPSKDVSTTTPTPPPVNSKAEFDQLKPGQGPVQKDTNIAEMLRNNSPCGQSPSPVPVTPVNTHSSSLVKPIGPPTPQTPTANQSGPITTTIAEVTNQQSKGSSWGSKSLAEALKAKPIVEKVEKPKLLDRSSAKPSSTVANNTTDSKKAKSVETKKPIQKQPPKSLMSEKAEKAVEKIEKSVNKENLENGDDEGTFDFDSFGKNIKFRILYTQQKKTTGTFLLDIIHLKKKF